MIKRIQQDGAIVRLIGEPSSAATAAVMWGLFAIFAAAAAALLFLGATMGDGKLMMAVSALPALLAFLCFRAAWARPYASGYIDCKQRYLRIQWMSRGTITKDTRIDFANIRSVFTEADDVEDTVNAQTGTLVVKLRGTKKQMRVPCDTDVAREAESLLLHAMGEELPPAIQGVRSFGRRAQWELDARLK